MNSKYGIINNEILLIKNNFKVISIINLVIFIEFIYFFIYFTKIFYKHSLRNPKREE